MEKYRFFEQPGPEASQIHARFRELANPVIAAKWADTFEIEIPDEKHVRILYHGKAKKSRFKKECKKLLWFCVSFVMGEGKKIKICRQKKRKTETGKKKNLWAAAFFVFGVAALCIATAVVVILFNYLDNRSLKETFYSASSIKVDSPVRVLQLSDLHSTSYGKENAKLIQRVKALKPDLIVCTGDMVEDPEKDLAFAVNLAEALSEIAPSYYIYGNNEVEDIYEFPLSQKELDKAFGFTEDNRDEGALLALDDPFEKALEEAGMKVLKNEMDTIRIRSMTVDVYGVLTSNPSSFWSYSGQRFLSYLSENPDHLKITAIHEPILFQEFEPESWGDLILCGHTHGGVARLPIVGPLYTKEGGLLPERSGAFVYGRYDTQGSPLVVSAGMENKTLLRINNPPEIVIVDINKF